MIADILADYAWRRASHERERDERIAECTAADAGIAPLRADISRLCYELAGCPVTGDDPDEIAARIAALRAELARRLAALGHGETYLDIDYDCDLCRDTGYIDGRMCDCLLRALHERRMGDTKLPLPCSFDSFDDGLYKGADAVHRIVAEAADAYPNGKTFYILTGGTGTGKTFALCCAARELIDRGVPVLYTHAYDMFADFHADRLGRDVDIKRYFHAPALFIDDLGSEPVTGNVSVEYFYNLVNERYEKKLFTAIATNLSKSGILERYLERTASRLYDASAAMVIALSGGDLRRG